MHDNEFLSPAVWIPVAVALISVGANVWQFIKNNKYQREIENLRAQHQRELENHKAVLDRQNEKYRRELEDQISFKKKKIEILGRLNGEFAEILKNMQKILAPKQQATHDEIPSLIMTTSKIRLEFFKYYDNIRAYLDMETCSQFDTLDKMMAFVLARCEEAIDDNAQLRYELDHRLWENEAQPVLSQTYSLLETKLRELMQPSK